MKWPKGKVLNPTIKSWKVLRNTFLVLKLRFKVKVKLSVIDFCLSHSNRIFKKRWCCRLSIIRDSFTQLGHFQKNIILNIYFRLRFCLMNSGYTYLIKFKFMSCGEGVFRLNFVLINFAKPNLFEFVYQNPLKLYFNCVFIQNSHLNLHMPDMN